jgi:hypothetical protein
MIKRLKKPCWIATCDNCGEDLFGYSEGILHFETKKELIEQIKEEADTQGKKHFCSTKCWSEAMGLTQSKTETALPPRTKVLGIRAD